MGNALRFLYSYCCKPATGGDAGSHGPQGVSTANVGVSALAHDIFQFEITSQVYFMNIAAVIQARFL